MSDDAGSLCPFTNPNPGSANLCTGEVEYASYGYNVRTWTAALFVALFGLTAAVHFVQALVSRRWFMLSTMCLCALVETLGWSARLWSAISAEWIPANGGFWYSNPQAFLMQIATLILAPVFLTAGWYILLGKIIKTFGPQYCRFNTKTYAIIFICGDVVSLVIQAVGGGLASAAETLEGANNGAYIMVGGVFAQMFVTTMFCIVLADFVYHYLQRKPVRQFRFRKTAPDAAIPTDSVSPSAERKAKVLIAAIIASTVLIYIRSIYRDIELLDGWNGSIIENQTLFDVLDAVMVLIATALFNVFHPMFFWPKAEEIQGAFVEEKAATYQGQSV